MTAEHPRSMDTKVAATRREGDTERPPSASCGFWRRLFGRRDTPPPTPPVADTEQPHRSVGVLFVHGIGQQAQSSCLREFSGPMTSWLEDWHQNNARGRTVRLTDSALSYGDQLGAVPAHFVLTVPGAAPANTATWVFAEGWWAARLDPPGLVSMLGWTLHIGRRIAVQLAVAAVGHLPNVWRHVARGGRKPGSFPQRLQAALGILIESVSLILLVVGYVAGALIGYLVLWPLFLVAHIPLAQVQQFVLLRLLRPLLVDFVGDFRVYVADPIQGVHIRHGVERAISWLATQCDDIIVVAHSQGAVVAYDALVAQQAAGIAKVRKLITMGGALNKAWELPDVPARLLLPLPPTIGWVDIWSCYDPVPGDTASRPGAQSHEVTNGMNVLTDHGGYFDNREEVIARLVQEADAGATDYQTSQFHLDQYGLRVRRRWERVITLVAWRLWTMFLIALVAIARFDQLLPDGRRIWDALGRIPGVHGLGDALTGIFQLTSDVAGAIGSATEPVGPVSIGFKLLRALLRPTTVEPLGMGLIALASYAAVFGIAYWVLTTLLYVPWKTEEARRATDRVFTDLPRSLRWFRWLRAVAVPLWLMIVAVALHP